MREENRAQKYDGTVRKEGYGPYNRTGRDQEAASEQQWCVNGQ